MPSLVKLYEEFKKDGFVVLAINVRENREVVRKFVEKNKIPFPVLLDKEGKVAGRYGIRVHPAHFLISRKGDFIGQTLGGRDWTSDEMIRFIGTIVGESKGQENN